MMTTARHQQIIAGHIDQHERDAAVIGRLHATIDAQKIELARQADELAAATAECDAAWEKAARLEAELLYRRHKESQ